MYHGFATINKKDKQDIKFTQTTPWPAQEFKLLTTSIDLKNQDTTKTLVRCTQISSYSASKVSKLIPGKLLKYDCKLAIGFKSLNQQGQTHESASEYGYIAIYSDYLNIPIYAPLGLPPAGTRISISISIDFINNDNIQTSVVLTDEQLMQ